MHKIITWNYKTMGHVTTGKLKVTSSRPSQRRKVIHIWVLTFSQWGHKTLFEKLLECYRGGPAVFLDLWSFWILLCGTFGFWDSGLWTQWKWMSCFWKGSGFFCLIKGTPWGNCKFLTGSFQGHQGSVHGGMEVIGFVASVKYQACTMAMTGLLKRLSVIVADSLNHTNVFVCLFVWMIFPSRELGNPKGDVNTKLATANLSHTNIGWRSMIISYTNQEIVIN